MPTPTKHQPQATGKRSAGQGNNFPDFQPKHHRLEAGTSSATETKPRDQSRWKFFLSKIIWGDLPVWRFWCRQQERKSSFLWDVLCGWFWMVTVRTRDSNAAKCQMLFSTFWPWLHQSFLFWTFSMKATQVVTLLIQMLRQSFSQLYSRALLWLTTLPIVATHSPQATRKLGEPCIWRPCLCQGQSGKIRHPNEKVI